MICAECIVAARLDAARSADIIANGDAVTIIDGTALCADHMMPLIRGRMKAKRL